MDHQSIAQLLGNYGEFLGSIAVVATLLYLVRQLRQNTSMMRASMAAEMTGHWLMNGSTIASDSEMSAAFYDTLKDPNSVAPEKAQKLIFWAINSFKSGEFAHHQWNEGNLDAALWESNVSLLERAMQIPNHPLTRAWPHIKYLYTPEYVVFIESLNRDNE